MALPTDSTERKHAPMFSGLLAYFPDALFAVAAHSYASNEKHNPGEPLHWSRDKSADHKDCIVRHMTDIAATPDNIDFEIEELKAASWRSLAALQIALEKKQRMVKAAEPILATAKRFDDFIASKVVDTRERQCSCGRVFDTEEAYISHFGPGATRENSPPFDSL